MVEFNVFKNMVTTLINCKAAQDKYLEQIPPDLSSFVYENEYVAQETNISDMALHLLLGDALCDEVSYYVYDRPTRALIEVDGISYNVSTLDGFFNYIEQEYYNERNPR